MRIHMERREVIADNGAIKKIWNNTERAITGVNPR